MKNSNLFLLLAIAGMGILIGIRIFDDSSERRRIFVAACTDYNLHMVEEACRKLTLKPSLEERMPILRARFTDFCECSATVWTTSGIKLRPEYFEEIKVAENLRNPQSRQIQMWYRGAMTRSDMARCYNRAGVNLNWIAEAHLAQRKARETPSPAAQKHR